MTTDKHADTSSDADQTANKAETASPPAAQTTNTSMSASTSSSAESKSGAKSTSGTESKSSTEPKPDVKPSSIPPSRQKPEKVKARVPKWMALLVLLSAASCVLLAYFGWYEFESQSIQQKRFAEMLELQEQQWFDTQKNIGQLDKRQAQQVGQWSASLAGVEQQVEQHSRRLKSLSTTSRDDWLLAEAEYLMRLANQRVLMERGTLGAVGLLESADNILEELDDTNLFGVRDKLSRDIAELKLTPKVDRSGLYLELSALADQIEKLPLVPVIQKYSDSEDAQQAPGVWKSDRVEDRSFWTKISDQFWEAMDKLKHQVRIRHHDQPMEPLLPPDGASYLRQNLRFHLEQAQLAMLREESVIYTESLQKAEAQLRQYFSTTAKALLIADELNGLSQRSVVIQLPDISGSLAALQDYIAELHLLDDRAGRPQLSDKLQLDKQQLDKQELNKQQSDKNPSNTTAPTTPSSSAEEAQD